MKGYCPSYTESGTFSSKNTLPWKIRYGAILEALSSTRFLTIFLFGLLLEKKNCFSCYVDGTTLLLVQLMVKSRCVKTT